MQLKCKFMHLIECIQYLIPCGNSIGKNSVAFDHTIGKQTNKHLRITTNVFGFLLMIGAPERCELNLNMNLDFAFFSWPVTGHAALFCQQVVEPVGPADTPLSSPPPKNHCGGSHCTVVVVLVEALK